MEKGRLSLPLPILHGTSEPVTGASTPHSAPRTDTKKKQVIRGYETTDSVLLTEPRIESIRRELQALLEIVELEAGGKPVTIDGFSLRHISDWADYPTSLSDIFWHLSSVCNFSCEFCYEKGNPPDFPIQNTPRMATPEEIDTRLRYYDSQRSRGIFTVRTAINEPFANRRAVEYLKRMRAKNPNELISFVTNGAYLDEATVEELTKLQPLFFNLSIYSTDPEVRENIIRDHRGDRAVRAVSILHRHKIAYMTNLVMWPSIPLSDMERTIAYMAEHGATVIRVCLAGYSRYLPGEFDHFRIADYWPGVVEAVDRIRDRYDCPILIEPNSYVRRDTEAYIDGIVRDSPAQLAGLRRGDLIISINGKLVKSRTQLLSELRNPGARSQEVRYRPPGVAGATGTLEREAFNQLTLEVLRGDRRFTVKLDRFDPASMATYPYGQVAHFNDFMYGLVLTDTLRYSSLQKARVIIDSRNARKVLLLTSEMILPILNYMLDKTSAFRGLDLAVRVAKNNYFGGSINVGDLLVVQDFVDAIREYQQTDGNPDLVLIPASPFASSPWIRDLTGRPWLEIERLTKVPVELIPCPNITF